MIRYLKNNEIDFEKWDACVAKAESSLIYGYTYYLSALAKNWDGIVVNNYEAVMPVIWNRKYFINYLYQPPFLQQTGIFSVAAITSTLIQEVMAVLTNRFLFAEIFTNIPAGISFTNLVLPLAADYKQLQSNYSKDLSRNLKIAEKNNLIYGFNCSYIEAAALYKQLYALRLAHVKEKDYERFINICTTLYKKNMLFVRSVYTREGVLLACGIFLKDKKRIYNIMSSVTGTGRKISANHFLFNELIKEFSGTNILLDFEGSEIPGVKKFYESFGAINEPYYFLKYNLLPQPLKWLKEISR